MRPRRRPWLAIVATGVIVALSGARGAVAELAPGTVLGSENWEEAKGLLPD